MAIEYYFTNISVYMKLKRNNRFKLWKQTKFFLDWSTIKLLHVNGRQQESQRLKKMNQLIKKELRMELTTKPKAKPKQKHAKYVENHLYDFNVLMI